MTIPPSPEQPPYQPGPTPPGTPGPSWGWPPPGPGEPFDGAATPNDLGRPLYGASLGQAIGRFFRGYVRFSGRASRSEYWFSRLFVALVSIVALVPLYAGLFLSVDWDKRVYHEYTDGTTSVSTGAVEFEQHPAGLALFAIGLGALILFQLATVIPNLSITWRRLHDGGFPGALWFLGFIPFGGVAVLVLTLLPPKPAGRRFDPGVRAGV